MFPCLYGLAGISTTFMHIPSQGMLKNFEKSLGILSPCHGTNAIDDKVRNSLQAEPETFSGLFGHFLRSCIAIQKRSGFGFRKAGFGGNFGQDVMPADVTTFREIGPEECL